MCVCCGGGGSGREETERGAADVGVCCGGRGREETERGVADVCVCCGGGGNGREETERGAADVGVCCRSGGRGREVGVGKQERTQKEPPSDLHYQLNDQSKTGYLIMDEIWRKQIQPQHLQHSWQPISWTTSSC